MCGCGCEGLGRGGQQCGVRKVSALISTTHHATRHSAAQLTWRRRRPVAAVGRDALHRLLGAGVQVGCAPRVPQVGGQAVQEGRGEHQWHVVGAAAGVQGGYGGGAGCASHAGGKGAVYDAE